MRHPDRDEQQDVAEGVLADLGLTERPCLLVYNKTDLLDGDELLALQERAGSGARNAVFVSAANPGGLEPLRRALAGAVRALHPIAEVTFAAVNGRLLAELHREGEVLRQRTEGDQLVLTARVGERLAGRLRQAGARVERLVARSS